MRNIMIEYWREEGKKDYSNKYLRKLLADRIRRERREKRFYS